jgi:hypothetical protein
VNACYNSGQNRLSSRVISKNINVKLYVTVILPFVLYVCPSLREEHRLSVFENKVLTKTVGLERE